MNTESLGFWLIYEKFKSLIASIRSAGDDIATLVRSIRDLNRNIAMLQVAVNELRDEIRDSQQP